MNRHNVNVQTTQVSTVIHVYTGKLV